MAAPRKVTETYDGGATKAEYIVDDNGKKQGPFKEYREDGTLKAKGTYRDDQIVGVYMAFHASGRVHVRAAYKDGVLQGPYVELDQKGRPTMSATYVDGKLHGVVKRYEDGKLAGEELWEHGERGLIDTGGAGGPSADNPKKAEVRRTLAAIERAPVTGPGTDEMKQAVRVLMAYRYLCGVPYDQMELFEQYNREAEAAAMVCEKLGQLTHKPEKNPGLPEEVFQLGKAGAGRSNLFSMSDLPVLPHFW